MDPHNLFRYEKDFPISKWCQENLRKFNYDDSKHACDIVTCDETRIYSYDMIPKQNYSWVVWVFPDVPKARKIVRSWSFKKKEKKKDYVFFQ